jgi:hypothetical protein
MVGRPRDEQGRDWAREGDWAGVCVCVCADPAEEAFEMRLLPPVDDEMECRDGMDSYPESWRFMGDGSGRRFSFCGVSGACVWVLGGESGAKSSMSWNEWYIVSEAAILDRDLDGPRGVVCEGIGVSALDKGRGGRMDVGSPVH